MTSRRVPDPLQGVFSTTLVVDGAPIALDVHLVRLAASVRSLYGAQLEPELSARALGAARGHALACLRMTAVPAGAAAVRVDVTVEAVARTSVLPGVAGAIDLRAVTLDAWPGVHKWVDRSALDALHARTEPAIPLLVGRDGAIRETIRGNVFALGADGVLRTPLTDGSILPGVGRAQLIALAREAGIDVREQRLAVADLLDAREAFATNAVRGVEPIRSLDGRPIPAQTGIAARLSTLVAERWF